MGVRLRAAREALGLSVHVAAGQAKISTGYLHKLESGVVGTPSPRVLQRVSAVLDVPYWTLMRLAGYVPEGDAPADMLPEPSRPVDRSEGDLPTNQRVIELLGAIRAELAELSKGHTQLRQAITAVGPREEVDPGRSHA
jgi:transcriptional regulator with XRE-family HTH domain